MSLLLLLLSGASGDTVTAQVGTGTFTGIAGSVSTGGVTVTAQVATGTFTGIAGGKTLGGVTTTGQVATATFTGLAGVVNMGVNGQTGTGTFTGVAGTVQTGGATVTAQVAAGTFTGIAGSTTGAVSKTAQVGTGTFTGIAGAPTPAFSQTAQIGTGTFSSVAGTATPALSLSAQVGTATYTGIAGTKTTGPVTQTAQVATASIVATPAFPNSLVLPGLANANATTPDSAALDITGDIEMVARVSLNDWSPTTSQTIVGKWRTTGNQRSYMLLQLGTTLTILTSSNGQNLGATEQAGANFSAAVDGATYWVKATRVSGTGACALYYAADQATEPTSWTLLGSPTMTYTGPIFSGTGVLEVGSTADGATFNLDGRVLRAIVRNTIGGSAVFDADFTTKAPGTSSFAETGSGATVTLNGAARITPTAFSTVTVTGQTATATLTGQPGTFTVGGVSQTAQVGTATLSSQPGTLTLAVSQTTQVGTGTFTGIAGTKTTGGVTTTAQIADAVFAGLNGTASSTGSGTQNAQIGLATFTGVAGTKVMGGVSITAQIATGTFAPVSGSVVAVVSKTAQIATATFFANPAQHGNALVTYQGELTNSFASIANIPAIDALSNTIELVSKVQMDGRGRRPTGPGVNWSGVRGGAILRSYVSYSTASGGVGIWTLWMNDGVSSVSISSSANLALQYIDGSTPIWLKVTYDGTNVRFYTAPATSDVGEAEPSSWTQLGTDRPSSGKTFVGGTGLSHYFMSYGVGENGGGFLYRAIARASAGGTPLYDVDFSKQRPGTSSFVDTAVSGKTVTVGAGASIAPNPLVAVTVTAQVATATFSGVAGVSTPGNASKTAQVATATYTGVAGTKTTGPATQTAQVATATFTPVAGTKVLGGISRTAQTALGSFNANPGALSSAATQTGQVATASFTGLSGALFPALSLPGANAVATFDGVPGVPSPAYVLLGGIAAAEFLGLPGTPKVSLYKLKWWNGSEWHPVPTKEYINGTWTATKRPKAYDPDQAEWIQLNA